MNGKAVAKRGASCSIPDAPSAAGTRSHLEGRSCGIPDARPVARFDSVALESFLQQVWRGHCFAQPRKRHECRSYGANLFEFFFFVLLSIKIAIHTTVNKGVTL